MISNMTSLMTDPVYDYYLASILYFLYAIHSQYIMTITCGLGIMANLICLSVLMKLRFKEEMYKHFIVKTVLEILILFSPFINFFARCESCFTYRTHFIYILRVVFLQFLSNATYTSSSWCEVAICYGRLYILQKGYYPIPQLSFKLITAVNLASGIFTSFPFLFTKNIILLGNTTNQYKDELNEFGRSSLYSYYIILVYAIQVFIPLISLLALNVIVTIQFRKFIERKNRLRWMLSRDRTMTKQLSNAVSIISNARNSHTLQNRAHVLLGFYGDAQEMELSVRFTRMVLVSSGLFTFTRLIQGISIIWYKIDIHKSEFNVHVTVFSYLSYEITFIYYTCNIIIYIILNNKFRETLKKLFFHRFCCLSRTR
jgi:hypothetical protein